MNLQRMKRILKKIFFLSPAATLLISVPAYGLVMYVLAGEEVSPVVAYGSYVLSAAKVISLTAALVSMLSLETAMLSQFGGDDDPQFRQIMTASTGAGIITAVLGMAVFMIVRSTKQLRQIKQEM